MYKFDFYPYKRRRWFGLSQTPSIEILFQVHWLLWSREWHQSIYSPVLKTLQDQTVSDFLQRGEWKKMDIESESMFVRNIITWALSITLSSLSLAKASAVSYRWSPSAIYIFLSRIRSHIFWFFSVLFKRQSLWATLLSSMTDNGLAFIPSWRKNRYYLLGRNINRRWGWN